jgi:transposase
MPKVSRLEVVSTGARRRWTLEEKQWIVAESYSGPRLMSVTARRNGLTSQLFMWRRLARDGRLTEDAAPALVPVEITSTPASASMCAPQPSSPPAQRARAGIIEIELGGCCLRVDRDLDTEALQRNHSAVWWIRAAHLGTIEKLSTMLRRDGPYESLELLAIARNIFENLVWLRLMNKDRQFGIVFYAQLLRNQIESVQAVRTHPTSAVLSDAIYSVKRVTLSLALRSSGDAGRGFGRVGAAAALVAG